ncbi:MAG: long-chain fatty acid--CoA ligase [Candidatus Omnitrophica bacterium]|nr:long-chain fatty acid--CoA ligase [Candidatus Omnitrophota bacterium]
MQANTLQEILRKTAKDHPQNTVIVFGRKKITYQQLDEITDQIAAGLIELGLKQGERIALFLDNCPEFIISYYAILKAGGVVVPINYMFKMEEAKFILQDSEAVILITSRVNIEMAKELRLRIDSLKDIIISASTQESLHDLQKIKSHRIGKLNKIESDPANLAVLLYTSGTTGFPKGAMLSHHNLVSNARDSSRAIKATQKDVVICILPLFHSFAATVCMNLPIQVGAKIVVMKAVRPFKRIIRTIRKNRVTVFAAIPSIYTILNNMKIPKVFHSPLIKLFNPIKVCISGAAALPVETFKEFQKKFRIPLLEGYGLTEASPVVTLNPIQGLRKPGSIGISLSPSIKLRIVDTYDRDLGPDEIGELLVKGPNVMAGYHKNQEATRETLKSGWLYTGDMAKFDSNHYFYIVGRKKEMVNVRGLNVYPREIEEVLYQNSKIKEAAVIGIADQHKGEVPKAFLVLKDGETATEHEIIHYLRERLASYKIPKYVDFRKALPKNATGKILKRLLKDEEDTN